MSKFDRHSIPDDLSIPAFLRATGPGTPHLGRSAVSHQCETDRPPGIGPSCWEEMNRDSDVRQAIELKNAVQQYEDEKRLAAFQQFAFENPELVAMNRKAKRDAERRIAKLGIPPATRRRAR